MTEASRKDLAELHNELVPDIVDKIVQPTLAAGGEVGHVLTLLEGAIVGVMMLTIRPGHDDEILDMVLAGAKKRCAEQRERKTSGGEQSKPITR